MKTIAPEDDEAPDTVPVPTPPLESGEKSLDIVLSPRQRRGGRTRSGKQVPAVRRPVDEMLDDIEKKEGAVDPSLVMFVLRAYRSLETTNRAQRELIQSLGREVSALNAKGKKR